MLYTMNSSLPGPVPSRPLPGTGKAQRKKLKKAKKDLQFEKECANIIKRKRSGCSAVGSVLEWGSRGRKFESSHSDQNAETSDGFSVFFIFCQIFSTLEF